METPTWRCLPAWRFARQVPLKQGGRVQDTDEREVEQRTRAEKDAAVGTAQEAEEAAISVRLPLCRESLSPLCILTRQASVPNEIYVCVLVC